MGPKGRVPDAGERWCGALAQTLELDGLAPDACVPEHPAVAVMPGATCAAAEGVPYSRPSDSIRPRGITEPRRDVTIRTVR